MLPAKTLIYDDNCPLCCWYTNAFVQTGLLDPDGRQSFTATDLARLPQLDLERSKDEIPLLDQAGGATLYGIDSLLYLLGRRWPWIPKIAARPPLRWCLRKLYKLISYNRRVIVAKPTPPGAFDCSPQFNYFYRYLYLLLALLLGGGGFALYGYFGNYALLVSGATLLPFFGSLLSLPRITDRPQRLHRLGILCTPLIPVGAFLTLAAMIPFLDLPLAVLAVLCGYWMWYLRSTID